MSTLIFIVMFWIIFSMIPPSLTLVLVYFSTHKEKLLTPNEANRQWFILSTSVNGALLGFIILAEII